MFDDLTLHTMSSQSLALLVALTSGCSTFDSDRPATWAEATVPDVYFVAEIPATAATASVSFATAPLDRQRLPLDFAINVASFGGVGDNYYNDTLDYLSLREPIEGENQWLWAGTFVLPPFLGGPTRDKITVGVQIRGMPYEATPTVPLAHRYCTIDLLGPGVTDCEPWADGIFHGKILCRGAVGQLIPCHGIGYEIVPRVLITGIAQRPGAAMDDGQFSFLIISGVTFTHHADGWRYWAHGVPEQGPFKEPEDAARDAAERLPWPAAIRSTGSEFLSDDDQLRLIDALRTETLKVTSGHLKP